LEANREIKAALDRIEAKLDVVATKDLLLLLWQVVKGQDETGNLEAHSCSTTCSHSASRSWNDGRAP
jgi:hypothetical protein